MKQNVYHLPTLGDDRNETQYYYYNIRYGLSDENNFYVF